MKLKSLILGLTAVVAFVVNGGTKIIKNGDTLVFAGDSITKFGNESEQGYVRLVVRGLAANGINVTYFGKGHSGWTASGIRGAFTGDVLDNHPQVVTIFAGVNDCGSGWTKENGGSSTPDDVAAMADMAIAAGITPVLLSPTGVKGEDFKQNVYDYAAAVKSIAQARNVPYAATYESYRAYIDDVANPKFNDQYKAASDGTHMSPVGNRIIAREVLKAFGFDSTEMARAEAAWNVVPGITSLHPSVKITDGEYKAMKVAAEKVGKSLGEYHLDLFARGIDLMKQGKAKVSATSGAAKQCSVSVPITYAQLDGMIDVGRAMTDHDSVPSIANYAMLAAVHELPAVTDADLPTEPVATVDTSVFSKQVEFTCSGYTGASTLTDFPVLVRLSSDSPSGFSYSDMSDSTKGDELRFVGDNGNSLPYEVESWNPAGTSLVWVKIPSLNAATSFTMYYGGDPSDTVATRWTWQAGDYVSVWHMADAIDWDVNGGVVSDSVNGLDANPIGSYAKTMQSATDGVFGKARVNSTKDAEYQGQSMLEVRDSTLLDLDGTFTFSGWIKMTNLPKSGLGRIASRGLGSNYAPQWELRMSDYTTLQAYSDSNTAVSGTVPSAQNAWVQIVGVFNGTTFTAYANGTKVFQQTIATSPNSDYRLMFGAKDDALPTGHFVGVFDEFRLRDAVSSADWVKAEYDQSKTSFLASGSVSNVTGGQPTHTHTWGTPAYTWTQTSSGYDCKATVACTSVSSHTKSMSVSATYSVVTAATEEAEGLGRYTATFTSAPFTSTTTKDVTIAKLTPSAGGDGPSAGGDDPVVNPPADDPIGATAASGDTTGASDTQTIQSLIDAAAASHGTVTLGSGIFYINAELNVHDGVTLKGQGMARTVVKAADGKSICCVQLQGGAKLERLTVTGGKQTTAWTHGAGVYVTDGTISWCCISNNAINCSNAYGAGVFFKKGTIDHSIVTGNTVSGSGQGAGIAAYTTAGNITIDSCLIYGNRSEGSEKGGAGIGMYVGYQSHTLSILNTTFADNVADNTGTTARGGAIFLDANNNSKLIMTNCIVSGNSSKGVAGDMYLEYSNKLQIDYCLFDKTADANGAHSVSGSAGFTNAAAGDYTLTASSPAKNAGATYTEIGVDLAGNNFAATPSMGCYEFGSSVNPGGSGEQGGVEEPPAEAGDPIELGTPEARPSTDYNGSVVTVTFTGDIPEGADMVAKLTLDGTDHAGLVDDKLGKVTFNIPSAAVTVGNTYEGIIMLFVGEQVCMKDVTLVQGTLVSDENASWIRESATSFGTTGAWAGEKAAVASGKVSVSNATFTASKAAPQAAVVTVESTFVFGDATDEAFNNTSRAGIKVVSVNGAKRYAFKTATGAATNLTVAAKTDSAVRVTVTLDNAAHKISYAVDGTSLGQYAMAEKTAGVATVRYEGETDVTSLNGSYVLNGLDTNLAKVGDTEYATVAEALAAGNGQVQLLWDSSWDPAASGDYTFNKDGFNLVIGGSLAYSVKDNGNGTVTVSVTGGDDAVEAPAPTAVTMSGNSVKVGVENVKPNLWYALEKTTDLTKPFVIDSTTWTKGSELINGDKELMIALYGNEPQAFYRVVVSTTASFVPFR